MNYNTDKQNKKVQTIWYLEFSFQGWGERKEIKKTNKSEKRALTDRKAWCPETMPDSVPIK